MFVLLILILTFDRRSYSKYRVRVRVNPNPSRDSNSGYKQILWTQSSHSNHRAKQLWRTIEFSGRNDVNQISKSSPQAFWRIHVMRAKRGGLARFPREISAFPSKKLYVYIFSWLIFILVSSLRTRTRWVNCSVRICFVCPVTCSVQEHSCLCGRCTDS